jgi:hypothetical protein
MSPRLDSLCPIFLHRSGRDFLEQIGSAVLLKISDEVLLLSAAHVLEQHSEGILSVPCRHSIRTVQGTLIAVGLPASGRRVDDRVDIACIKLDRVIANDLDPMLRPLDRCDLALFDTLRSGDHYTFAGYPWRKSEFKQNVACTTLTTFTGEASSPEVYQRVGYSPNFHVVIRYRRKKSISFRTRRREMAPLPHGVSGGGVFSWQKDIIQNPREPELRLCAIAHTYLANESLLIGTRLGPYLALIEHNWPEMLEGEGVAYLPRPTMMSVVWYKQDEWNQLRRDFADAAEMPSSWEEWRHRAEELIEKLSISGLLPIPVELSVAEIRDFCQQQNLKNVSHARSELASIRFAESTLGIRVDSSKLQFPIEFKRQYGVER